MTDLTILDDLVPIIVLLFLGVATAIAARAVRLSPIVGYLALGVALRALGLGAVFEQSTIALLAQLGVVFLLVDVGLHFSLEHVRQQASDIFAFGPAQVILSGGAIFIIGLIFGLAPLPALLVGGVLALSSTAVVARLIAERHQQNCPVGLTATSILVFQDIAAIFLLILAGSIEGTGPLWIALCLALSKAVAAFGFTLLAARLLIGPLLRLVARSKNEEVFTATALLIALSAGWATGRIGLSLTLGAFLGGLSLAETPYRAVIVAEIRPFRGLLLGFFFISIGLSLDVAFLGQHWPLVIGLTTLLLATKVLTNIVASRIFQWSVPGSTQLGFLLAQGSEFGFVILSLPTVSRLVGATTSSIIISVIALSMAVTPNLAEAGRALAGRMRRRLEKKVDAELTRRDAAEPVIIVGMGTIGRAVADALIHFGIGYSAVESNEHRLQTAIADGYNVSFGDGFDMRMWQSVNLRDRKASVLTAPDLDALAETHELIKTNFPGLTRYASARSEIDAGKLREFGLLPFVDQGPRVASNIIAALLADFGVSPTDIERWDQEKATASSQPRQKVAIAA